jgi:hypothetical protein
VWLVPCLRAWPRAPSPLSVFPASSFLPRGPVGWRTLVPREARSRVPMWHALCQRIP